MQRNLLILQQQALARQQQRAAAAAAAATGGGGIPPDPMANNWMQQQRMRQMAFLPQQQQLENENRLKQQKLQQQQKMASMYMQQQQQQQQQPQLPPQQQQQRMQAQAMPSMQQQQQQQPVQPMKVQPQVSPANAIPVKNPLQQKNLDLYVSRDQAYQVTLDTQHKRHMELAQSKKHAIDVANNERRIRQQNRGLLTFGKGYDGYGNGKTGLNNRVVYPGDKKRKKHQSFRLPYETIVEQANKEETLVPIRLDIEHDGYKLRDTFTWNMNETSITTDQFAEVLCEDLRLPTGAFVPLISTSIKEQIQDYFLNASSMINDTNESTEDRETNAYEEFIKQKKLKLEDENVVIEEKTEIDRKGIELRTVIKLDIIVGNRILNDQFEWDITCKNNSPESFANTMATDLGLGGEFKTAIAHSIREQVHVYIKSLLLTGYEFGDGPVENDDLKRSFLPSLKGILRDRSKIDQFTPSLIEVTDAEIAKIEKGRTRESRRKRRGVRNRKGATLPDRDPIPTYRTIFASPPEHEMTDDQFMKSMQTSNDNSHSQRKSAMKARMNIAAEAAGVSLTSGQLVNDNSFSPLVQQQPHMGANTNFQSNVDMATRPVPSK
ncbi:unnamed protein product [Mucor hiemalis]